VLHIVRDRRPERLIHLREVGTPDRIDNWWCDTAHATRLAKRPAELAALPPKLSPVETDSERLHGRDGSVRNVRATQAHSSDLGRSRWTVVKSHNPKVVGSNPTPATIASGQRPRFGGASLAPKKDQSRGPFPGNREGPLTMARRRRMAPELQAE